MSVTHAVARPMLAGMFVYGGLDAVRHPEPKAPKAETVGPAVAEPLGLPTDPVTLVRINGAVQVTAGALLAIGKAPRLASLALAASLVPTTLAGHRFWEEEDDGQRAQQQIQFLKNVAMLGGLVFAATDTGGRPSLTWRAKRATRRSRRATKAARAQTKALAAAAAKARDTTGERARELAGSAALQALAAKAKDAASHVDWDEVAEHAKESAGRALETAAEGARQTAEWARESALPRARDAAGSVDWDAVAARAKEAASAIPWDSAAAKARHAATSVDWDDVADQARESAGRAYGTAAVRARRTAKQARVAAKRARQAVPAA